MRRGDRHGSAGASDPPGRARGWPGWTRRVRDRGDLEGQGRRHLPTWAQVNPAPVVRGDHDVPHQAHLPVPRRRTGSGRRPGCGAARWSVSTPCRRVMPSSGCAVASQEAKRSRSGVAATRRVSSPGLTLIETSVASTVPPRETVTRTGTVTPSGPTGPGQGIDRLPSVVRGADRDGLSEEGLTVGQVRDDGFVDDDRDSATSPAGMRWDHRDGHLVAVLERDSRGRGSASSAAVPSSDQVASSTIDWPGIGAPTLAGTELPVQTVPKRGTWWRTTRAMAPTTAAQDQGGHPRAHADAPALPGWGPTARWMARRRSSSTWGTSPMCVT